MPIYPMFDPRGAQGVLDATGDDLKLLEEVQRMSALRELGSTGLKRAGGYLDEEFLPQLRGRKAVSVFKEMAENDPTIGGLLFTIDRLLRNLEWRVEPAGKRKQDTKAAQLVETCMEDMSTSWDDFITEALSMLVYGWAWHEIVYKRRNGLWSSDPRHRSKHSDGLIGWRKMPIRAQETLLRWIFDDSGDVRGMVQLAPPRYQTIPLPIERSLLFRYRHHKGNPEGVSMLRNAYRPWFMKKRIEEFEAVGLERDLAGLPIVHVPAHMLRAKEGTEDHRAVQNFTKLVKTVRRNEQEGVVFPSAFDQDTKQPLYRFELLGGGGGRAFNTDQIIQRYDLAILVTVLADFIKVGHEQTGSYSLHTDKTGIFRTSLNSIAQTIADVLNRHAIPKLFAVNGWKPDALPTIVPNDVDNPDIGQLSQFMSSLAGTGVTWFPDPVLENFVRDVARLPKLDEDAEERLRQLQMRTEATEFATATAEYLAAQQQAQQASMDPVQQAAMEGEAQAAQQNVMAHATGDLEERASQEELAAQQQEEERAQMADQQLREDDDKAYERSASDRDFALKVRESRLKSREKKK